MSDRPKPKVGDWLWRYSGRSQPPLQRVRVISVGPKWITVQYGNRERFSAKIWMEEHGHSVRLYSSEEEYEQEVGRSSAWLALRRVIDRKYSAPNHLAIGDIDEMIAKIIGETGQGLAREGGE